MVWWQEVRQKDDRGEGQQAFPLMTSRCCCPVGLGDTLNKPGEGKGIPRFQGWDIDCEPNGVESGEELSEIRPHGSLNRILRHLLVPSDKDFLSPWQAAIPRRSTP